MTDFCKISSSYAEKSVVQASAGEMLMEMIGIPRDAAVLDVGCGTGNLTAALRQVTGGRIVGVDPAPGMIRQAQTLYGDRGIEFRVLGCHQLTYRGEFDVIYCNSAFQWFKEPLSALGRFAEALRPGGRFGMQAPATSRYCPNFVEAIERCSRSGILADCFSGFNPPWLFLESAQEYTRLLEQGGFQVLDCRIEEAHRHCTPDQAVEIFHSGAAAGYLNQDCFAKPLPSDFATLMTAEIRDFFSEQAGSQGELDLVFYRVFAVAQKPED